MKISNISMVIQVVLVLMACILFFGFGGKETQEKDLASIIESFSAKIISGKCISYDFVHRGEGTLADQFPETSGQVKVIPKSGRDIGRVSRVRILAEKKRESGVEKINVALAEGISYSLDEQKKVLWRAPSYRSGVQMFNFQYIFPITGLPDIQKAPADGATIVRRDKVDNVSCVVVIAACPDSGYCLYNLTIKTIEVVEFRTSD